MLMYQPAINCSSIQNPPTAFVADPFLWVTKSSELYAFYEYKSKATEKGEIGVATSMYVSHKLWYINPFCNRDGGATWQHLGTALTETYHLSYPFVFLYQGQVYMLPEGYQVRMPRCSKHTTLHLRAVRCACTAPFAFR